MKSLMPMRRAKRSGDLVSPATRVTGRCPLNTDSVVRMVLRLRRRNQSTIAHEKARRSGDRDGKDVHACSIGSIANNDPFSFWGLNPILTTAPRRCVRVG